MEEGGWRYIRNYFERKEELYNLEEDPMETINLASSEKNRTKIMREKLFHWVDKNLNGHTDPTWIQTAKWVAAFKNDFPDLKTETHGHRGTQRIDKFQLIFMKVKIKRMG